MNDMIAALPDLPDGSPSGPDLESDIRFIEMQQAAKGKPEGQFGNTLEPAKPPDWKQTADYAEDLMKHTRDLRVMAQLAVARLHLSGFAGFGSGIALIRQALETLWDDVHPKLDPEDDNDPMPRANALLTLQSAVSVLRPLRELPLAGVGRERPVTFRDLMVLAGALEPEPGREKMSETEVRGVFIKTDPERLSNTRAAVSGILSDLVAIGAVFDAKSGPGNAPDMDTLLKLVREMDRDLARYEAAAIEARAAGQETAEEAPVDTAGEVVAGDSSGPVRAGRVSIRSITTIGSREDALHALTLASAYYAANEPASPLPLLIDRAIRLAPLPFLEILRDMAPDGLLQAYGVAGTQPQ